jgi:flagellar basal body-associated protein FliL
MFILIVVLTALACTGIFFWMLRPQHDKALDELARQERARAAMRRFCEVASAPGSGSRAI